MKPIVKLAIVAGIQVVILMSLIGFRQYTLWTGDDVLLRAQPIDTSELLRREFGRVQYEISELDLRELAGDDDVSGSVWVELQEQPDGHWEAVAAHDDSGERSFDGTVLLKGDIEGRFPPNVILVHYGIEEVYIPAGSADDVPPGAGHDVAVKVTVDRWGHAIPRDFSIDGERFDLKRR